MISQDADPARILPPLPPSTLTDGILHRTAAGEPATGAGVLTPQARLAHGATLVGRAPGYTSLGFPDPRQITPIPSASFAPAADPPGAPTDAAGLRKGTTLDMTDRL